MTYVIKTQILFSKNAIIMIRGGKKKKKKNDYYAFKFSKSGKTSE